nr:hypothetical protein [Tanacetum cinerariifolium]
MKTNETLVAFKERWAAETGFIVGVPKVMMISSFMDAHKCPELAKRYSNKVPKTVDEMMVRLDDFVISEEAFANIELPRGEVSDAPKRLARPVSQKEDRFHKGGYKADKRRNDGRNIFNNMDGLALYRHQTPNQVLRGDHQGYNHLRLNLNSLTKQPKEILALELQLNLQPPRLMQLLPKKENQDRYYASDEPLVIIEAVMDGYLVRRVYVDQGASVEVMFKHFFKNLDTTIKSRLRSTQMDLVGFAGDVVKPLGLQILRAVYSTIHSMIKFPTPRGITTLVTKTLIISECRSDEITWKTFRENTHDLGLILEETGQDCNLAQRRLKELLTEGRDGVRIPCDTIWIKDDKEKTAFYTNKGIYCYTKMSFGLKNAGATYQRLVDMAFQSQTGRNLEAYMDDMVIKSNDEKSLSSKLATLKRFLSRSAKRSLPFFKTLKDITKENKDEYRWTEEAEKELQEMKNIIVKLPLLTTPWKKEMIYIYLAVKEAVSVVLLMEWNGKQFPIHYVSKTLNEAEKNYAPLEKLALSLLHMSCKTHMKNTINLKFLQV